MSEEIRELMIGDDVVAVEDLSVNHIRVPAGTLGEVVGIGMEPLERFCTVQWPKVDRWGQHVWKGGDATVVPLTRGVVNAPLTADDLGELIDALHEVTGGSADPESPRGALLARLLRLRATLTTPSE